MRFVLPAPFGTPSFQSSMRRLRAVASSNSSSPTQPSPSRPAQTDEWVWRSGWNDSWQCRDAL